MTALDPSTKRSLERIEVCKKILLDRIELRNAKAEGVPDARLLVYYRRQNPAFAAALRLYPEEILALAKSLPAHETLKANFGSISNRELFHFWASKNESIAYVVSELEKTDPYFFNHLDHFQTVSRDFRALQAQGFCKDTKA